MTKVISSDEITVNDYTRLGSGAPSVKTKKITFTTASTEGGLTQVSHGLDRTKILSCSIFVQPSFPSNVDVPPNLSAEANSEYGFEIKTDDIAVTNKSGNSSLILSRPGRIFIVYEE